MYVRLVRVPAADFVGSMPLRLLAPVPTAIEKPRIFSLKIIEPNEELLRPSSHSSICRPETTGTSRDAAEATIASDSGELATSVCMLATKAP